MWVEGGTCRSRGRGGYMVMVGVKEEGETKGWMRKQRAVHLLHHLFRLLHPVVVPLILNVRDDILWIAVYV